MIDAIDSDVQIILSIKEGKNIFKNIFTFGRSLSHYLQ